MPFFSNTPIYAINLLIMFIMFHQAEIKTNYSSINYMFILRFFKIRFVITKAMS